MPPRESGPDAEFASLPHLRFTIVEAARILRICRAQLYKRIQEGLLRPHKDGARTYFTPAELERYIESRGSLPARVSRERPVSMPPQAANGRHRARRYP